MVQNPINMQFTIDSIQKGIEYWLSTEVFGRYVEVESVIWLSQKNVFEVSLKQIDVGKNDD